MKINREFILFLLMGGFAAIVNYSSRFFYNEYMTFDKAIVLAYTTGMIIAFILFRLFVFGSSNHSMGKEILFFVLVNVLSFIQTYIVSIFLAEYFFPKIEFYWYPHAIAHAIGIGIPAFTSYYGHKYLTFKENYNVSKK